MSAIVARAVTKRFSQHDVLKDLDLSVPAGAIFGLLGRNGAGKTTLLKLFMGLLFPSAGVVRVLGLDLAAGTQEQRQLVGYVAERGLLPDWMSIGNVIDFEASVRRLFSPARVWAYVTSQALDHRRAIKFLSKGQRKRVELEIVLAGHPQVLILDEPFDGLDPVSRAEAMEALVAHAASTGASVLISSHILSDLERICDRIAVLAGRRIAFESEVDCLKESISVVSGPSLAENGRLSVTAEVIANRSDVVGNTWVVRGLAPQQERDLRQRGFQLARPSLDELGLELIRCFSAQEGRQ